MARAKSIIGAKPKEELPIEFNLEFEPAVIDSTL